MSAPTRPVPIPQVGDRLPLGAFDGPSDGVARDYGATLPNTDRRRYHTAGRTSAPFAGLGLGQSLTVHPTPTVIGHAEESATIFPLRARTRHRHSARRSLYSSTR